MKKNLSRILLTLVAICAIFFLSGCKANLITKINSDGSGSYAQEIGFTAEEMTTLNSMGTESSVSFCESTKSEMTDMPANMVMTEEKRGEETWCVFKAPFANLEELKTIYGTNEIVINDISLVDGKIHYDVTMDLSGGDFGSTVGMVEMKWIVGMPGKVSNHNADEVSGSTLTWILTPGQVENMFADSSKAGLFSSRYILIGIVLLCLCILMIIIIAGMVFFVVSRNKKKQALVAEVDQTN